MRDSFGNVCGRLVAPAGGVTLRGSALVRDSGLPDAIVPNGAGRSRSTSCRDDVLLYLMAKPLLRDRQTDRRAWSLFGNTPTGWARVAGGSRLPCTTTSASGYQHGPSHEIRPRRLRAGHRRVPRILPIWR